MQRTRKKGDTRLVLLPPGYKVRHFERRPVQVGHMQLPRWAPGALRAALSRAVPRALICPAPPPPMSGGLALGLASRDRCGTQQQRAAPRRPAADAPADAAAARQDIDAATARLHAAAVARVQDNAVITRSTRNQMDGREPSGGGF